MNIKKLLPAVLLALAAMPVRAGVRVALVDAETQNYGQIISTRTTNLCFKLIDEYGFDTSTNVPVSVKLADAEYDWQFGNSVAAQVFFSTNDFTSSVPVTSSPTLIIPSPPSDGSGCADTLFRVGTSTVGIVGLRAFSPTLQAAGLYGDAFFGLNVLGAGAVFSGLSVDNGTDAPGASASLTPDRDGTRDFLRIRGQAPMNGPWLVEISSAGATPVRTLYGYGSLIDIAWYGEDDRGRTVPNATYSIAFKSGSITGGGLSATVNTGFIFGTVVNSTPSFVAARVNVNGPGGGGFGESSNDDGLFKVWGLRAGQSYGVFVDAAGYIGQGINNVVVSATGTNLGTITVQRGAFLHVAAQRQMGPVGTNPPVWANLRANTTDYTASSYGTIHFDVETSTSDNGDYWVSPASFTVMGVPPSRTIKLRLEIYQYGVFTRDVTAPAPGQILNVFFASTEVVKQPTVGGTITLTTPTVFGAWVSVDGVKLGDQYPTVYGGGFVGPGQSTTSYSLFGVSPGTWTFRAFSQGYKSTSTMIPGISTNTPHNITIDVGGKATGTVFLTGNLSGVTASSFGGGTGCPSGSGKIPVSINAWSPTSFSNSWTGVCVSTTTPPYSSTFSLTGLDDGVYEVHTYLPGFELNPPGRRLLTMSGGTGSLNITYDRLAGALALTVIHSTADAAGQISYQVNAARGGGPESFSEGPTAFTFFTSSQSIASMNGMGTGLYQVTVMNNNPGSGLRKTAGVAVVNGSTSTLTIDLRETTYSAAGRVSFDGSLSLPFPWNQVNVSSAAGLLSVTQGTAPIVEVFSFPLPAHFHGSVMPYKVASVVPVAGQTYGTFTVTGLTPGAYLLRVRNDLNPPSCGNCGNPPPGDAEFATGNEVVFITTASVTGVDIPLSNGVTLTGSIQSPQTETGRQFEIELRKDDQLTVYQTSVPFTGTSASFSFQHLADGDYTLSVRDRVSSGQAAKYVAPPARVTIAGAAVTADPVELELAGVIVGKLRDEDSDTLITNQNAATFLGDRFNLRAEANPRVPGGWAEMLRCDGSQQGCSGSVYISSVTGNFAIHRLRPGLVYDVNIKGFEGFDPSAAARGQKAYAPIVISGIAVEAGQTVDLGVIDLSQGVGLSGTVVDASSTPLPNVRVIAYPAQLDGGDRRDLAVEGFTDQSGNYNLLGVDRANNRYYNVIASPRPDRGDVGSLLTGPRYGQEIVRNVDTQDPSKRTGINFTLVPANASLSGSVRTADGGPLEQPFGDGGGSGFRENSAAVVLQLDGAASDADNPLGDIEEKTDPLGNFSVAGLKPGSYVMRIISVGYVTEKRNILVSAGANSAGTVTLSRGGSLTGTITKPDGSSPTTGEVNFLAAFDDGFEEFAIARLKADGDSGEVSGYSLDGFKPGISYSIIAGGEDGGDILSLAEGVTFAASTETQTLNLVYKPAAPSVYVNQSRSGNTYTLRFFSTHKLRNLTLDDSDLRVIVTTASPSAGTINYSSSSISSSRNTIEVVYDAAPSEASFSLRLAFTSAVQDLESATGANFTYDDTFQFYAGVGKSRIVRISNTMGGDCSLEGSAAGGDFPAGTFDVAGSSSINVGIQSATDVDVLAAFAAPRVTARARALSIGDAAARLGRAAYPTQGFYKAAAAAPSVSPFSNFYDIFLPAGVSHTLKKDALITLQYDDSQPGFDPDDINVYYFDPNNNVYLLEDADRVVDTVNKTITVAVRHLSTFVVLNGNAQVVGTNSYAGGAIQVHNVPNPFNLQSKSVALSNASPAQSLTTEGTIIRYALPPGKSGAVKIDIFNAAGELVRTISHTAPTGGSYYYVEWNGRNDGGKKVASGVYVGRLTVNDGDEKFFKMAVIK